MESLSPDRLRELQLRANDIRVGIIRSLVAAGSGHSGGSLDMADIFAALYFHVLRHDPKNPDKPDRDRLLLSCGHIAPVRYSAMANAGYFPLEELLTLRHFGTRLQGHPERVSLPGWRRRPARSAKASRKARGWRSARAWTEPTGASTSSRRTASISAACIGRR